MKLIFTLITILILAGCATNKEKHHTAPITAPSTSQIQSNISKSQNSVAKALSFSDGITRQITSANDDITNAIGKLTSMSERAEIVRKIELSLDDKTKLIDEIQSLSREQKLSLNSANKKIKTAIDENGKLKLELVYIKQSNNDALSNVNALQREVNHLAEDRNNQAKEKDKALTDRDYWTNKHKEAVKKLWWWRIWAGGLTILGVCLIGVGLLMRFTSWGAKNITPIISKAIL